jgi:hypothetical protein
VRGFFVDTAVIFLCLLVIVGVPECSNRIVLDDGVESDFGKGLRVNSTGDVVARASLEVFEVFFEVSSAKI